MSQFIDLVEKRFGRLVIIKRMDNDKFGNLRWLCQCDCGKEIIVAGSSLNRGLTQSCGCLNKEIIRERSTKHGHTVKGKVTEIYTSWVSMIQRCTNPSNKNYKYYGGRGIKVCKRWMKFENFLEDMGEKPGGLSLDRKNNNKNYCKSNCRWATSKEQNRNSRHNHLITCFGKTQCLAAWAEETGIPQSTIRARIRLGWSSERTLT